MNLHNIVPEESNRFQMTIYYMILFTSNVQRRPDYKDKNPSDGDRLLASMLADPITVPRKQARLEALILSLRTGGTWYAMTRLRVERTRRS